MLQRIQSIWLFFATACLFSMFMFPYAQFINEAGLPTTVKVTGVYQIINAQQVQTEPFTLLMIATVILALIPFVIIFYYKNRKLQLAMCYVTIILIIAHSFWLAQTAKAIIGSVPMQLGNYSIGAMLPSIAIIFLIMALRGIRKDEKLIRSVDRLR